jgi:AcrR family transcriptional regulator
MPKQPNRREELKAKKQAYVADEILMSAVSLFAKRGFRAVTIDDIASNLGYTKSVVYYYFSSKIEILSQIFARSHDVFIDSARATVALQLGPVETMTRLIREHAEHVMNRPDWNAIYWREESELDEKQRKQILARKHEYDGVIESVYSEGVKQGVFKDIPPGIAVRALLGMCNSSYLWFKENGALSAEEVADYFVTMLMDGFSLKPTVQEGNSQRGRGKAAQSTAA